MDDLDIGSGLITDSEMISPADLSQKELAKVLSKDDLKRDQGLVRPKVLILAPFKQMAY